jgi:hypothetical protein
MGGKGGTDKKLFVVIGLLLIFTGESNKNKKLKEFFKIIL